MKINFKKNNVFFVGISFILIIIVVFFYINWYNNTVKKSQITQQQRILQQQRERLLQKKEVIQANWMRSMNPIAQNITGDLVWSSEQQTGMIRFKQLPTIEKTQRYQLLIYDAENTSQKAIQGVTFSSHKKRSDELFILIKPKTKIRNPYKFVIYLIDIQKIVKPQILLLVQP